MKYFIILTLVVPTFLHAQKSEVVPDSAENKQQIFSKSIAWVAKQWVSANDVVQLKDEAEGTIIVKGGLKSVPKSLGIPAKGITMSTVTIRVKDGKAKIEFEDTFFKWESGPVWKTTDDKTAGQFEKWRDASLKEMDDLIDSYKKSLSKKDDF